MRWRSLHKLHRGIQYTDEKGRQNYVNENDDVSELLTAMKDISERENEGGITGGGNTDYMFGLTTFFEGDQDKGIALIAKAANGGYPIRLNVGYLQAVYDHPGFARSSRCRKHGKNASKAGCSRLSAMTVLTKRSGSLRMELVSDLPQLAEIRLKGLPIKEPHPIIDAGPSWPVCRI